VLFFDDPDGYTCIRSHPQRIKKAGALAFNLRTNNGCFLGIVHKYLLLLTHLFLGFWRVCTRLVRTAPRRFEHQLL
jgi:hypothetical protein